MSVQDEVADTGLMMMGHRFYAPDLGRFLNRDPIGFAGGLNLFEYAGSSPINHIDPAGLFLSRAEAQILARGLALIAGASTATFASGAIVIGGVTVKLTDMFVPGYYANQDNGGQFGDRALEMMASDETWAYFNPNDAIGVHGMAKRLQELANSTGGICKGDIVRGNKKRGKDFEKEMLAILQRLYPAPDYFVDGQGFFDTPFGRRFMDFMIYSMPDETALFGIETKTGNAKYSKSQLMKDLYLEQLLDIYIHVIWKPKGGM